MLQRILNIIFSKFYFLKFILPNYFFKKMTTITDNQIISENDKSSDETSNLEVEMEKSSLDSELLDSELYEINVEKAEQFKNEGNEKFKSNLPIDTILFFQSTM